MSTGNTNKLSFLAHTNQKGGILMSVDKGKKKKKKSKEELNAMKGGKERHRRNRS
ncbi:hypothetical protein OSO01_35150 [Oceanobacillus sojae]|uniref:Uncharacterized protein n=1 Tax=Oceanobacillus sojae TaxID=582851 RepID=A0A511ZMU6_9BACI|nr:hypothetical protein OSO01_35150 [Oceanobacillus sojae]